jgi:probable rRNA maturation factor
MTKGALPRVPFVAIKDKILGKDYELSLVFATKSLSKKLNNIHRGKNYPTNILSFPLDKKSGEIFIEPVKARLDAPEFDMNYTKFIKFLFIHGCLHLKGMQHSSTMDKAEKKFLKIFS